MRLGGWARFGIALTVVWSALMALYVSIETVTGYKIQVLAMWLTPIALLWISGLTARWIYRGFRQP